MAEGKVLNTKLKKFYVILVSLLILLIPMAFLSGVIDDRESYKNEAVSNIGKSWAGEQILFAPKLFLYISKDKKNPKQALSLGNYEINVKINTEIRKKGIFKIPVYTASVKSKGYFKNPYGSIKNIKSELFFDVSDSKGFVEAPKFKLANDELKVTDDNICIRYLTLNSDKIPFEIEYKLRGINTLSVEPSGTTSKISISGNWKDPGFEGDYLPQERTVTSKDFSAYWSVPKIATVKSDGVVTNKASVSLLTPVDNYRMSLRSVKYAFLFLLLTFVAYYVFEITQKKNTPIHPIQYMLMGGALLIFYLLLTSISEFIPFVWAYVISVLFTVGLICTYTYFVLTKKQNPKFTLLITSAILLLYTFLYTLLVIQDFSLLIGSFILFVIVAAIMYATRNVEWYEGNDD